MVKLRIIFLSIFVLANVSFGVLDEGEPEKSHPHSAADLPKIENPLAKKVLDKYQSINTYHAVWTMEPNLADPNITKEQIVAIWEVAFDRPNKRILFSIRSQPLDSKQPSQIGQLFISDGKMMHFAVSMGNNSEPQKRSVPIDDPNQLTYRNVRKGLFLRPFDLPLIFSELHFMEVIEDQIKEIKTLEESESLLRFEVLPQSGETSAVFGVDPNTLLIERFNFNYHSPSGSFPVFKLKTIEIDRPLDDALFDVEKQLLQQGKPKESDVLSGKSKG